MRTFAIILVFGLGASLLLQNSLVLAQPGGGGGRGGPQGGQQWQNVQQPGVQGAQQPISIMIPNAQGQPVQVQPIQVRPVQAQPMQGQPMQGRPAGQQQQGGGAPWMQQQGAQNQQGRPAQPAAQNQQGRPAQPAAQNQQARPAPPAAGGNQPGALNANQITQIAARLRALDTSGTGVLQTNAIPANQRDRVNTMIAQLGGNPNAASINIGNLERQAMARAGAQPNEQQRQQQAQGEPRQQQPRQQSVEPLVRPFGEAAPPQTPVLGFGQRPTVLQPAQMGRAQQQQAQQVRQQAANQQAVQAARNANVARQSDVYDSIPPSLRNNPNFAWFFEFDTDNDGQISMAEYVAGLSGSGLTMQEIASQFAGFVDENGEFVFGLDRNGDGFATLEEALVTVEEHTKREAARAAANPQPQTPARAAPTVRPVQGGAAAQTRPAGVQNAAQMRGGPQGNQPQSNQPSAWGGPGGRGNPAGGGNPAMNRGGR